MERTVSDWHSYTTPCPVGISLLKRASAPLLFMHPSWLLHHVCVERPTRRWAETTDNVDGVKEVSGIDDKPLGRSSAEFHGLGDGKDFGARFASILSKQTPRGQRTVGQRST